MFRDTPRISYGGKFKNWFNDRYWNKPLRDTANGQGTQQPSYEFCGHRWCLRWARYDHRCHRHF